MLFLVKLPVDAPKQKKILPKPSSTNQHASHDHSSTNNTKPFAWSRPPGRIQINNDEHTNKNLNSAPPINTDLDTMEAAHVLATAADVTMAADARRKAQQHDDDMMVDETPSNIAGEETIQCDDNETKHITQQQLGTITANIIDENGIEHTVLLSTEEAQQLLGTQGAIIVDSGKKKKTFVYLTHFCIKMVNQYQFNKPNPKHLFHHLHLIKLNYKHYLLKLVLIQIHH